MKFSNNAYGISFQSETKSKAKHTILYKKDVDIIYNKYVMVTMVQSDLKLKAKRGGITCYPKTYSIGSDPNDQVHRMLGGLSCLQLYCLKYWRYYLLHSHSGKKLWSEIGRWPWLLNPS
jgi:hypothetical protein